ncbi:tetratricopeptide repeat protein [Pseudoroseomonas cervicalis]|uniref:tetratricopeptide repeat protein n=1 Tax=Teichococcus cervicalis TaxID=204525 RepID=UPI002789FBD1|nr:tetratricopeptide repeat protein [Pseudoroseomonas cervicalis]MDQ1081643.1 hypothetical protein [Pseudoroseomonas cervicalis]
MTLSPPPTHLLAESGRLSALYQPRGSGALVISLAPRQAERRIWGEDFLARLGVSVLGLVDQGAAWYPQAEMARLLPALREVLAAHRRVVLYGFSMGGYAALKYAAALRADAVLAFSPQYSVHPDDVGDFDFRRSRQDFDPALHEGMRITAADLSGQALLFRDPLFAEDARHAALIAEAAPVRLVPTPLSAHDSVRFAAEAGWVEPLLRAALQEAPPRGLAPRPVPEALLRRHIRPRRLRSLQYGLGLAETLGARRGEAAALAVLQRAVAVGNSSARLRLELAHRLLDAGRVAEAETLLAAGFPRPPGAAEAPLAQEFQARLARLRGESLPVQPGEAALWQAARDFLRGRLFPGESLLVPEGFGALPEGALPAAPQTDRLPDWAVLRHAGLPALGQGWLRRLAAETEPVLAEPGFSIWARVPSFGLIDRRDHPAIRRLRRDLTRDWVPG